MTQKIEKKSAESEQKIAPPKKRRRGVSFLLIFLLSAWMFFLGVLVGRGTAPVGFNIEKLRDELRDLKKLALKTEVRNGKTTESDQITEALGFYDELKKGNEKYPMDIRVKKDSGMKIKISEKIIKSNRSDNRSAEEIAETSKTAPEKRYSIQVASSKNKKEADKLVERYAENGFPAYLISVEVKNSGTWHRVRIGPYDNHEVAANVLAKIRNIRSDALILEHEP